MQPEVGAMPQLGPALSSPGCSSCCRVAAAEQAGDLGVLGQTSVTCPSDGSVDGIK